MLTNDINFLRDQVSPVFQHFNNTKLLFIQCGRHKEIRPGLYCRAAGYTVFKSGLFFFKVMLTRFPEQHFLAVEHLWTLVELFSYHNNRGQISLLDTCWCSCFLNYSVLAASSAAASIYFPFPPSHLWVQRRPSSIWLCCLAYSQRQTEGRAGSCVGNQRTGIWNTQTHTGESFSCVSTGQQFTVKCFDNFILGFGVELTQNNTNHRVQNKLDNCALTLKPCVILVCFFPSPTTPPFSLCETSEWLFFSLR